MEVALRQLERVHRPNDPRCLSVLFAMADSRLCSMSSLDQGEMMEKVEKFRSWKDGKSDGNLYSRTILLIVQRFFLMIGMQTLLTKAIRTR